MGLIRLALFGATAYGIYRYTQRPTLIPAGTHAHDGLAAMFRTREQADLAIEHLVQEHGIDRTTIFVESAGDENTSGSEISGGDAPSGDSGTRTRGDAALNGGIRLTVPTSEGRVGVLRQTLNDAGAEQIQAY
jgi:hypothetical protein